MTHDANYWSVLNLLYYDTSYWLTCTIFIDVKITTIKLSLKFSVSKNSVLLVYSNEASQKRIILVIFLYSYFNQEISYLCMRVVDSHGKWRFNRGVMLLPVLWFIFVDGSIVNKSQSPRSKRGIRMILTYQSKIRIYFLVGIECVRQSIRLYVRYKRWLRLESF